MRETLRHVVALAIGLAPIAFGFLALTDPPAAGDPTWYVPAADRSQPVERRTTAHGQR